MANIRRGMRSLVEGCRTGDSLVFHFSGHGGKVIIEEDDEYEESYYGPSVLSTVISPTTRSTGPLSVHWCRVSSSTPSSTPATATLSWILQTFAISEGSVRSE
jgi:hypothetical protein